MYYQPLKCYYQNYLKYYERIMDDAKKHSSSRTCKNDKKR